jgi:hypothetical protein
MSLSLITQPLQEHIGKWWYSSTRLNPYYMEMSGHISVPAFFSGKELPDLIRRKLVGPRAGLNE